jgi:hypothetical protein
LSELGFHSLAVAWAAQDPVKALIVAACVCIVLWYLLDDGGWDFDALDASDGGDGGGD